MTNRVCVDVGVDISTTCVGFCVLSAKDGTYEDMFSVKLNKKSLQDIWDKAHFVRSEFAKRYLKSNWSIQNLFVEEAHMRFSPGFSSAKTLFTLAMFNGIVSYVLHQDYAAKPIMVNVRSARSKMGLKVDYKDKSKSTKDKVFEIVRGWNPNFPWVVRIPKSGKNKGQQVFAKENYDMADAYVICRGGQLLTK